MVKTTLFGIRQPNKMMVAIVSPLRQVSIRAIKGITVLMPISWTTLTIAIILPKK